MFIVIEVQDTFSPFHTYLYLSLFSHSETKAFAFCAKEIPNSLAFHSKTPSSGASHFLFRLETSALLFPLLPPRPQRGLMIPLVLVLRLWWTQDWLKNLKGCLSSSLHTAPRLGTKRCLSWCFLSASGSVCELTAGRATECLCSCAWDKGLKFIECLVPQGYSMLKVAFEFLNLNLFLNSWGKNSVDLHIWITIIFIHIIKICLVGGMRQPFFLDPDIFFPAYLTCFCELWNQL